MKETDKIDVNQEQNASLEVYFLNGEKIKLELASVYEKTEDVLEVFQIQEKILIYELTLFIF
jgi:hypothetical protein